VSRALRLVERKHEPPIVAGRVPPHDLDVEGAVLSAVLIADALVRVRDIVSSEDFYAEANGRIFEAACAAADANDSKVDVVLVGAWLRDREMLAAVGGAAYLAQLADATPDPHHVEAHAKVLARHARRRRMIAEAQMIAAEGYGDVGDDEAWTAEAPERLERISRQARFESAEGISTVVGRALGPKARVKCVSTGIDSIDEVLCGGLYMRELSFLTGPTGRGKSALAANLTVNVGCYREDDGSHPQAVLYLMMEDEREPLANRMLVANARVDARRYKMSQNPNGQPLSPEEHSRLVAAGSWLATLPIEIDDSKDLTIRDIEARVVIAKEQHERAGRKLVLVVIDYLQLIDVSDLLQERETRERKVAESANRLQRMSEKYDCHIMCLAQSILKDDEWHVRESQGAEKHAKTWIDLRREAKGPGRVEPVNVNVRKQRNGPWPAEAPFWFHSWCLLFSDQERT
jgi:replicative DNA helicase